MAHTAPHIHAFHMTEHKQVFGQSREKMVSVGTGDHVKVLKTAPPSSSETLFLSFCFHVNLHGSQPLPLSELTGKLKQVEKEANRKQHMHHSGMLAHQK